MTKPELTIQDRRDLNRRAKAHGLPCLWPEAERMEWRSETETRVRGVWEEPRIVMYERTEFGTPREVIHAPGKGFFPVSYFENLYSAGQQSGFDLAQGRSYMAVDPVHKPPTSPSLWSRVKRGLEDVRDYLGEIFSQQ